VEEINTKTKQVENRFLFIKLLKFCMETLNMKNKEEKTMKKIFTFANLQ